MYGFDARVVLYEGEKTKISLSRGGIGLDCTVSLNSSVLHLLSFANKTCYSQNSLKGVRCCHFRVERDLLLHRTSNQ